VIEIADGVWWDGNEARLRGLRDEMRAEHARVSALPDGEVVPPLDDTPAYVRNAIRWLERNPIPPRRRAPSLPDAALGFADAMLDFVDSVSSAADPDGWDEEWNVR
jgi:hypothetical protein